jgi:hypothetical protein
VIKIDMHILRLVRHELVIGLLATALVVSACQQGHRTLPVEQDVAAEGVTVWTFDQDSAGQPPENTESLSGVWEVREESDAPSAPNALCQTGNATFPAIQLGDEQLRDATISLRFKPISGEQDQAAGLIFRMQDADNFYIVRANALEDNVNIYTYIDGNRTPIAEGNATVEQGVWQTLRIAMTGTDIKAYLNDTLVVETTDNTFEMGSVGLWTKADSITCFDNVQISQ